MKACFSFTHRPGTQIPELIHKFDLSRIVKAAAVFDNKKLCWVTGQVTDPKAFSIESRDMLTMTNVTAPS